MDKNEVISFFDIHSTSWDENMEKDDRKINEILDVAKISSGKSVLDIACGTGVMIDYYIERNVSKITGVDISSKMIEIARNKFKKYDFIDFLCEDAEEFNFKNQYDRVMVFNAFPHFPNPKALIKNLAKAVKSGGTVQSLTTGAEKTLTTTTKAFRQARFQTDLSTKTL